MPGGGGGGGAGSGNWKQWQRERQALRPSAEQLQGEAREKRRQRRQCFDCVLDRVYARIASKAKLGWVRVVYEVPPFFVGLPPYDVNDCVKFVARGLRRDGYLVETFGHVVYISWDPKEKSAADSNGSG